MWRRDTYCSSSSGRSRSWAAWSRTAVHCESAAAADADADARGRPAEARGTGSAPPCPSDDDQDDDECCPPGRIDLRPCRRSAAAAGAADRRLRRPKPRYSWSCCWAWCCWSRLRLENGRHWIGHYASTRPFIRSRSESRRCRGIIGEAITVIASEHWETNWLNEMRLIWKSKHNLYRYVLKCTCLKWRLNTLSLSLTRISFNSIRL